MNKIPFYPLFVLLKQIIKYGPVQFKRVHIILGIAFRFLLLEPFRLAEILLFERKIKRHKLLADPVFIIGHWRSGTSHLQELMVQDSRHATLTLFEFLFSDNSIMTVRWLKPILNKFCSIFQIQYGFQRKIMSFDYAAEMDPALCSSCSTEAYTWGHIFPRKFKEIVDSLILNTSPLQRERWGNQLKYHIQKTSYLNNGKRVIVKAPGYTARVSEIKELYPKAKFIYIHRDPLKVYHSTKYLWNVILKQNSFQIITAQQLQENILYGYNKLLTTYLQNRDCLSGNQLVELSLKDLNLCPYETIQRAYEKLELGSAPLKDIRLYLADIPIPKAQSYVTTPEEMALIESQWKFSFEAWPNDLSNVE
jgi:hypothetical protein